VDFLLLSLLLPDSVAVVPIRLAGANMKNETAFSAAAHTPARALKTRRSSSRRRGTFSFVAISKHGHGSPNPCESARVTCSFPLTGYGDDDAEDRLLELLG